MSASTEAFCHPCWDKREPDRPAVHTHDGEREICCMCGRTTWSGIYVRVNTEEVKYPRATT